MAGSFPLAPGIETPPKDGKGNNLAKKDGRFVPNSGKPSVSVKALNEATDNGINTRALIEAGSLEKLQPDTGNTKSSRNTKTAKEPGKPAVTVATVKRNYGSSDPGLNAQITTATKRFGQQLWNVKVNLYNHQQTVFQLSPESIHTMVIEDDLLSWPLNGFIVIDNRSENFERNTNDDAFYHIRADGRDELFLDLYPADNNNTFSDDIWRLKMHVSVYDVQDMPSDDVTNKRKKLYFWDKKFQMLQEQTIQWSTATGPRTSDFKSKIITGPISQATDEARSMYTGEAVASLLMAAGYEEFIDWEQWDWGAGKINFVAKANWSVWKCISYIITQHVSESNLDQPLCGLGYDRAKEKWTLVPRWRAYEASTDLNTSTGQSVKPGALQLEHFFLASRTSTDDEFVSPWKAPVTNDPADKFTKDIKSAGYNTILSYQFSQMSGMDSAKAIVSKPVYSHQHKNKQFQVDVQENEITSVKEFFKSQYVDRLLGNGYPVMVTNRTKTEELSICPVFSPVSTLDPIEDRRNRSEKGKGAILFAGVFLNQCLSITIPGSSSRIAGTFVGIDRLQDNSDTDYDYQLCGQYFVVKVAHVFDGDSYVNQLTLVKVHAYDKLMNNEDVY